MWWTICGCNKASIKQIYSVEYKIKSNRNCWAGEVNELIIESEGGVSSCVRNLLL